VGERGGYGKSGRGEEAREKELGGAGR